MIGRSFNKLSQNQLNKVISSNIKQLFSNGIVFGNLETAITESQNKTEMDKTFYFRATPDNASILNSFHVLSLANNHILDFREQGMKDTIKTLDKLDIIHSGAGDNLEEASKVKLFKYGNLVFGFLSCADHYKEWSAKNTETKEDKTDIKQSKAGTWIIDTSDEKSLNSTIEIVKNAKKECNFLIMYIHWGSNWVDKIPKEQINFGHKLIDAGVDIIVGTSSHHILPIEKYKNKLIIYGIGDFINDYAVNTDYNSDISMIVKVEINEKGEINTFAREHILIRNMTVDLLKIQ